MKLYLDLETKSEIDIRKVGGYRYANDPTTSVLLFAYAIDDMPARVVDFDKNMVQKLLDDASIIIAHNSMFDRTVLKAQGLKTHDHKWYDTMIQAYAHSYAGGLGTLTEILGLPTDKAKDKAGKKLINLFSCPQPKNRKLKWCDKNTHPNEWQQFIEYARLDVEAMREVHKLLPSCNYKFGDSEHQLWLLDQQINDRGVRVDTELADAAIKMIDLEKIRLADESKELTKGEIQSTSQTQASLDFIKSEYGITLPDFKKSTIEEFLTSNEDLPDELVSFLENRNQSATSSASKYQTIQQANVNGYIHGMLQFCGANRTGRWAGRLFQPQNLPRPELSQVDIDLGIELIKAGCPEILTDNHMQLASSCIRGLIIPRDNHKLLVSDLSAIEGRVLAWLAGEQWELDAYARGDDIYKITYSKAFGIPVANVTKEQRQIGKVMTLALGYAGGVGAFVAMAVVYGIDLDDLARQVLPTLAPEVLEKSKNTYQWFCDNKGVPEMAKNTWLAIDGLKVLWRQSHPRVTKLWYATENAVKDAINNRDVTYHINDKLAVRCSANGLLRVKLPSGRYLCYPNAHLAGKEIKYKGTHFISKKWVSQSTYSGKLVENYTQAVARDILAHNMTLIAEKANILLTVHDEIIVETPVNSDFTHEDLSSLLANQPSWAAGLPLNAEGFECTRYKKD